MSRIRSDLVRAALALVVAFVVTTAAVSVLFSRGFVIGDFMAPALRDGDAIVVDRASGRFIDYRPGEIVSLQIPGEPCPLVSIQQFTDERFAALRRKAGIPPPGEPAAVPYHKGLTGNEVNVRSPGLQGLSENVVKLRHNEIVSGGVRRAMQNGCIIRQDGHRA